MTRERLASRDCGVRASRDGEKHADRRTRGARAATLRAPRAGARPHGTWYMVGTWLNIQQDPWRRAARINSEVSMNQAEAREHTHTGAVRVCRRTIHKLNDATANTNDTGHLQHEHATEAGTKVRE